MKKKLMTGLVVLMTSLACTAFAAHEDTDRYEATCQSTGNYETAQYAYANYEKNNQYQIMHHWGSCGDEPAYLEIDTVEKVKGNVGVKGAVERHHVEFWEQPQQKDAAGYWKSAFCRVYYTDAEGKVIKSEKHGRNYTRVLVIERPNINEFVIHEKVSAKIGSPLFDSAVGPFPCYRGGESEGLIEHAYMEFQKRLQK